MGMGMGKGVKPGLGHHLCLTDTIFFFLWGGGSRGTGLLLSGNIGK